LDEIALRNKAHESVEVSESAFKAEYESAKHVKCILQVLNATDGAKQGMLSDCRSASVDSSNLTITYPPIPGPANCDRSPVSHPPGDDKWRIDEYQGKTWNADGKAPVVATAANCAAEATSTTAAPTTGQTQCPDTWVNIEGKCYSPPEGTPVLVGKAGFPSGAANYCQNLDSSAQIMTREEAEAYLASPLGADKPCQSNNRDCGRPLGKQHGYTRTISGSSIWLTNYGFFHPHPSSLDRWFSCVKTID